MSCDEKVMVWLALMEKCPTNIYTELLLLSKFDNSSPSVTRDKDLSHDYELMSLLPPEEEYPMEPFQWCSPAVRICF